MDFDPTDEQRLVIDTVRRFVREEILPLEADLDPDASELEPADRDRLVAKTKAMGFYGLDIPEEYGGPGIDIVTRTLMAIEMSQHRAGLYAPCYGVFGGAGLAQLYEANDDQKERYLYPDAARREARLLRPHRALRRQRPGARHPHHRGAQRRRLDPQRREDVHLRRRQGAVRPDLRAQRRRRWAGAASPASSSTPTRRVSACAASSTRCARATTPPSSSSQNARVPAANVLGEVGGGFAIAADRVSRQRIPYAAGCIGLAIRAQEMAIEWARVRSTFGDVLASRQAIQWMIVDNEIDIRTSRWFTLAAAHRAAKGLPFRTEAAMAKLVATEASARVVDRSMQIHGGYGMTKDLPLERWWRELRIRRIGEGPNEVQRLIIARDLLGGSFH